MVSIRFTEFTARSAVAVMFVIHVLQLNENMSLLNLLPARCGYALGEQITSINFTEFPLNVIV